MAAKTMDRVRMIPKWTKQVTPRLRAQCVGIDLAPTATGFASKEEFTFKSPAAYGLGTRRDMYYVDTICSHIPPRCPLVAMEGLAFGVGKKFPHALAVQWGLHRVIKVALYQRRLRVVEVAPTTLKKWATGYGKADKDDVTAAACEESGRIMGEHEADAYWLRQIAMEICLPKTARERGRDKWKQTKGGITGANLAGFRACTADLLRVEARR